MIETNHTTGTEMLIPATTPAPPLPTRQADITHEIWLLERAYAELTALRNSHPWASAGTADLAATGSILRSIADLELELLDLAGL